MLLTCCQRRRVWKRLDTLTMDIRTMSALFFNLTVIAVPDAKADVQRNLAQWNCIRNYENVHWEGNKRGSPNRRH